MTFEFPIFGLIILFVFYIFSTIVNPELYDKNDPHAPLKPLKRPAPKPIFEQLAVMEHLGLTLQRSSNGKIFATSTIQDHVLTAEAVGDDFDRQIKLSILAAHPLASPKQQASSYTVADIARILVPENPAIRGMVRGVVNVDHSSNTITYQQPNRELDIDVLEHAINYIIDLAEIYPNIVALGGLVVPTLITETNVRPFLHPFVAQVLRDIAMDTQSRLQARASRLTCPTCLTRFGSHTVKLPNRFIKSVRYYGCRTCGQSREYLVGELVAVLDEAMTEPIKTSIGVVRVNWLANQRPFDFDRVEIKQASDEVVERFAVQVGNDTDVQRQEIYPQVPCAISSKSRLKENTRRILDNTFGPLNHG